MCRKIVPNTVEYRWLVSAASAKGLLIWIFFPILRSQIMWLNTYVLSFFSSKFSFLCRRQPCAVTAWTYLPVCVVLLLAPALGRKSPRSVIHIIFTKPRFAFAPLACISIRSQVTNSKPDPVRFITSCGPLKEIKSGDCFLPIVFVFVFLFILVEICPKILFLKLFSRNPM